MNIKYILESEIDRTERDMDKFFSKFVARSCIKIMKKCIKWIDYTEGIKK